MAEGGRIVEPIDEDGKETSVPFVEMSEEANRGAIDVAAFGASSGANGAAAVERGVVNHEEGVVGKPLPATSSGEHQSAQVAYSLMEVAKHLQISPDTLRSWNQRFAQMLHIDPNAESPRYSSADVAVLLTIQKMIDQRMSDEQVIKQLMPRRIEPERSAASLAVQRAGEAGEGGISSAAQALTDVLSVIAGSQQSVLNSQSSMREMVTVVVQDNFNLKDENRKLRDRMLELERVLAEYQRREETRKERMEARMRALEGTVAALQQQMAQFVQLQRAQARKKGFW
jgi:DNA-binding transcriptional MerR regulator